jgi:hypothetical protein
VKKFMVTFLRARTTAQGIPIVDFDRATMGGESIDSVRESLSTIGFFHERLEIQIMPGAILSVEELKRR